MLEEPVGKNPSKQYRIYVGSIPGYIDSKEIQQHFEHFGPITRVRMFYAEPNSNINKGYCHLFASDEATHQKILDHPHHAMQGRRLYCCAYISGRKLRSHNVQSNSKRVVVRNIPSWLTGSDLRALFERFGAVEMAYIFTPHGLMHQPLDQNQTGSVQFSDARTAEALVKKRSLLIRLKHQKHCFSVYPYIHNYNCFKAIQKDIDKLYQDDASLDAGSDRDSQPRAAAGNKDRRRKCLLAKRVVAAVPYHQIRPTSAAYFSQLVLLRELTLVSDRDIRFNRQPGPLAGRPRFDFQSSDAMQRPADEQRDPHSEAPQSGTIKDSLEPADRPEASSAIIRTQIRLTSLTASLTNSTLTERSGRSGSARKRFCATRPEPSNARTKTAEHLMKFAGRLPESCEASPDPAPALSEALSQSSFVSPSLLISSRL